MKRLPCSPFKVLKTLLFGSMLFMGTEPALAAACCGGGFSAPAIIAGDEKAQLTASIAVTEVTVGNVDASGIWRKWDEHQRVQSYKIEGAHIFQDRWQLGFSVPVTQRTFGAHSYSGMGDITTSLGYEYLTDWSFNPFRPKGIGFLQVTFPTGKAQAESEVGGLDSMGRGLWALGVGTLLTKAISAYDLFALFDIHRSFARTVSSSQLSGELRPGYGGSLGLGAGYNFSSVRLGGSITWVYEDPIEIKGRAPSPGAPERYATTTFTASYLKGREWAGTLSYSDQTLMGNPINTSLGKTWALILQRRWAR